MNRNRSRLTILLYLSVGLGMLLFLAPGRANELANGARPASASRRLSSSLAIASTTPPDGATGIPLGTDAVVQFSEPINPATFSGSVNGQPLVATQVVFDLANTTATIDFGEMSYSALHLVVIDGTVQDPLGNPLGSAFAFSFRTAANANPKRPATTINVPTGPIQAGQPIALTGQASGSVWQRDAGNPLALRHWDSAGNDLGDSPMLHPAALYFPAGFDGYKFYLYYTPYPPSSDENPALMRSNDGVIFTAAGVPLNPLFTFGTQPPFDMGNLADPEAYRLGNTWMLFYEQETSELLGPWMHGGGYIGVAFSSDGLNWIPYGGPYTYDPANPPTGFPANGNPILYPESSVPYEAAGGAKSGEIGVFFKDGEYHLWRTVVGDAMVVAYDTAPDPRGPWTKQGVAVTISGSYGPHPDVVYDPERNIYLMMVLIDSGQLGVYTASTPAGPWTAHPLNPVFQAQGGWEAGSLYRASLVEVDGQWFMYYSGSPGSGNIGLAREAAGVRTVEVSTDGGSTWGPAAVQSDGTWSFAWTPVRQDNVVKARVTDDFMRGDPATTEVNGVVGGIPGGASGGQPAAISCAAQTALETPTMPILAVTDSGNAGNPFGCYLTEILRGEGLVEFQHAERSLLMAAPDPAAYLSAFRVVVLGEMALSPAEETLFRNFVSAGGRLIAMRPDADLADLFGLSYVGTRPEQLLQYFAVDTGRDPGAGIVGASLQYHGAADNYTLAGAASLASLYDDISTPSGNPAATLNYFGAGQAAAFTFDLAKSIVLTRQGNPAWKDTEGDGIGGYRPMDLFRRTNGDSYFAPVRMPIPQADEEQRFFANLILSMAERPMPRMWYLPDGVKRLVVNTGDSEGNSGAELEPPMNAVAARGGFFTHFMMTAAIDGTSVAQEAAWRAAGHETSVHSSGIDSDLASQQASYGGVVGALAAKYGHAARTCRNHTIDWVGWSEMAQIEASFGTGLDTNYYHYVGFLGNPIGANGYFTGSGLPQRFSDENGNLLGIYQALTEWSDENYADQGVSASQTVQIMINMLQAAQNNGYYSAFVDNIHPVRYNGVDPITHIWADQIWDYCAANGIPLWSAQMLLDFTEARNNARFDNLAWNGSTLAFDFSTPLAGHGTTLMVPARSAGGTLLTLTVGGSPVAITTETIKGRDYALFTVNAATAPVVATYGIDTMSPVISNVQVPNVSDTTARVTWDTDELATSRVDYGTASGHPTLSMTVPGFALSHSVALTGLLPETTYYYQVTSADQAGNPSSTTEATFQSGLPRWVETTSADFSDGALSNVEVVSDGGGAFRLGVASGFYDDFTGTALDTTQWLKRNVFTLGEPTNVSVDNSQVTVSDGTFIRTIQTFFQETVEGRVTLLDGPNSHFGFATTIQSGDDGIADPHWAMYTSRGGTIFARTRVADGLGGPGGEIDTPLPGVAPGVEHLYRVAWKSDNTIEFWVDGTRLAIHTRVITDQLRVFLTSNTSPQSASADWISVSGAFAPTGTYESSLFDSGGHGHFDALAWTGIQPAGTSADFETRTSLDGVSWSGWEGVGAGSFIASPDGQYIQYRATLSTTDPALTPRVDDVTITYRSGPDTAPPAVAAIAPANLATAVAITTNISIAYREPIDPATFSAVISGGIAFDTTFTDGNRTVVLNPVADLLHATLYTVTVAPGVRDLAGNATTLPYSFSFTTSVAPPASCFYETTQTDFTGGTLENTVVAGTGDGAVTLGTGSLLVPLLSDSFTEPDGPAANWTPLNGTWTVRNNEYTNSITYPSYGASVITGRRLDHFVFESKQRVAPGSGIIVGGLLWGIQDATPGPEGVDQAWKHGSYMLQWDSNQSRIFRWDGFSSLALLGTNTNVRATSEFTTLRLEVNGPSFELFVNGISVLTASDSTYGAGAIGFMGHNTADTRYDDVNLSEMRTNAGFYTSKVYDAGETANWGAVTWTSSEPAGSSLAISVRTGDTPTPDGTWTEFIAMPSSGSPVGASSRYIQYRAELATTNPANPPALLDLSIACGPLCTPTASSDTTCDGIDDDCDGSIDEDYVAAPTICGVGHCAGNAGLLTCVAGSTVDSCNPLAGAAAETCNGVDDDCNGLIDDVPPATIAIASGWSGIPGQTLAPIPVAVSDLTGLGVFSGDLTVTFDPGVLSVVSVSDGTVLAGHGCTLTPNTGTPGHLTISLFCTQALAGAGSLADVTFEVTSTTYGSTTTLALSPATLNEGCPAVVASAGQFTVRGPEICDGQDNDGNGSVDEGGAALCDDGVGCTVDSCGGTQGCVHTADAGVCADSSPCSVDSCDPVQGCLHTPGNAGTECRASAGVCDVAEVCDGASNDCPADGFQPVTVECRASGGVCDVAEFCTGTAAACPVDAVQAATHECRASAGACDLAELCDGTDKACPTDLKSTAECRPSAGLCDVAEVCDGVANDCPVDHFQPATLECRGATGVCDVAELCTGAAAACPVDAVQPATYECRASAGVCDLAELCDGADKACPTDQKSTAECRAPAGLCDVAEVCDGVANDCPANGYQPNGTGCDDGNGCTLTDVCQTGVCVGSNLRNCTDNNDCTDDACLPATGQCEHVADDSNLCTDGNVCTTDQCSAGACLHTVSGVCGVSGSILYYRSNLPGAGTEPTVKPVPGVGVDANADATADDTTTVSGGYAIGNLAGNASVQPLAKYGTPRAADNNGAITSLDASVIARAAVGLLTPSTNQRIAGDVTGDGTIGAFDASYVARFSVELVDHFPVAESAGTDWKFLRCDDYTNPSAPDFCAPPLYSFTPITQGESNRNFYAVLYGDVTGNWQPAGGLITPADLRGTSPEEVAAMASDQALAAQLTPEIANRAERRPAGQAELSLGQWTGPLRAGERRQVTISLANADGILGLDLVLKYDPSRMVIKGVDATGIGTGQSVVQNSAAGTTRIAMYGMLPLSGSGAILNVTIEGVKSSGAKAPLTVSGLANEGAIPLVVQGKRPAPATRR